MFDTDNRLLAMIKQSQIPLGMQCFTGDRAMIEVLGLTGFDFVMLDTEHSPANPRAIEDAVLAADSVELPAELEAMRRLGVTPDVMLASRAGLTVGDQHRG